MIKSRLLLMVLVVGSSSLAVAGERSAALLPVEGDPALAERLAQELPGLLGRRGLMVLSPEQSRRLLAAETTIARSLAAADQLTSQANRSLLRMQRAAAVAAARQALGALEQAAARFHSPQALSRAHDTLARALLLRPADEPGAADAFARAIAADPSYAPDPDRSPPRVRALAEQARQRIQTPGAPTAEVLSRLASAAPAGQLIWISVRRGSPQHQAELVIFSAARGSIQLHQHLALAEAQLAPGTAASIATALGGSAPLVSPPGPTSRPPLAAPATAPVKLPPPRLVPVSPAASGRRWYQHWWVWTVAGVVVAGTAVGLGVGLTRSASNGPGWDVSFSF